MLKNRRSIAGSGEFAAMPASMSCPSGTIARAAVRISEKFCATTSDVCRTGFCAAPCGAKKKSAAIEVAARTSLECVHIS